MKDHKLTTYTRVPKVPDPEKATANEVMRYHGYFAFQEYFAELLKKKLCKRYSEKSVEEILKHVNSNEILIFNKGLFFNYNLPIEDADSLAFKKGVTLERYLRDIVFEIKRQMSFGADRIVLTSFLVNIARILKEAEEAQLRMDDIYSLMNNFVLSIASIGTESPVYVRILDDMLLRTLAGKWNTCIEKYPLAVKLYFNAMTKVFDTRQKTAVEIPKVEFMRAVYSPRDYEILKKIEKEFKVSFNVIEKLLAGIDLAFPSTELEVALDRIQNMSDNKETNIRDFAKRITNPSHIVENKIYFNSVSPSWSNEYKAIKFYANLNKTRIYNKYVNLDFFREESLDVYSNIFVNCIRCSNPEEIIPLIDCAMRLHLVRVASNGDRSIPKGQLVLKTTLFNVTHKLSPADISKLKIKLKKLRSEHGYDIVFEVQHTNVKMVPIDMRAKETECIRIVSDLHVDINKDQGYVYDFKDDFVVCCGDISGDAVTSIDWINNNIQQGVFVHGNHLGYSRNLTLNESVDLLEKTFPSSGPVQYLNNTCYTYQGIVFLGCCLYTDFKLYGEDKQDACMVAAARGMNDFIYPRYEDKEGKIRSLIPDDYERFFIKSKMFLKEKLVENLGKPIVIVTHFAPSEQSVGEQYRGSSLNPAFVCDMTDLMNRYPNIRLWCHGHCHTNSDYIYNKTRVIARPFGYYTERLANSGSFGYGFRVKIKDIKSMLPWEEIIQGNKKDSE